MIFRYQLLSIDPTFLFLEKLAIYHVYIPKVALILFCIIYYNKLYPINMFKQTIYMVFTITVFKAMWHNMQHEIFQLNILLP
jgi:hypothetical protein